MKKILVIVGVLVAVFIGIQMFADDKTKDAANDAVDTGKDAADKAGDHVNSDNAVGWLQSAADWVAGLPQSFWSQIVPLLIVGGAVIWIIKDPRRRAIGFGVAALALLVFIISTLA